MLGMTEVERLDGWEGGLLLSQASICVSVYSQTSSFQTQSDYIWFCAKRRADFVEFRAHALKL